MGVRGRAQAVSMDDIQVDYSSILDQEDRLRRWSEDVVDLELRDNVRLNKLYRKQYYLSILIKGCYNSSVLHNSS